MCVLCARACVCELKIEVLLQTERTDGTSCGRIRSYYQELLVALHKHKNGYYTFSLDYRQYYCKTHSFTITYSYLYMIINYVLLLLLTIPHLCTNTVII